MAPSYMAPSYMAPQHIPSTAMSSTVSLAAHPTEQELTTVLGPKVGAPWEELGTGDSKMLYFTYNIYI